MEIAYVLKEEIREKFGACKEIYIFGAGKEARRIILLMKEYSIIPQASLVSDLSKNSNYIENVKVLELGEMIPNDLHKSSVVVAVSEIRRQEVFMLLEEYGLKKIYVVCTEIWEQSRNRPKLEITAKIGCSINCKYCPQDLLLRSYFSVNKNRQSLMDFEDYKKCISHMPQNTLVSFAGFVEPFFHPQCIDMIKYAHNEGFEVELFTTFQGLNFEKYLEIRDIPFKQVVLHTPDEMEYANIQMTEEYKRILDDALNTYKINGTMLIDSANCQSEPSEEFLKLANNRINVESSLVDRAGNLNDEHLRSVLEIKGEIYCNRTKNFDHWVLLPDGDVVLCCMDFGLSHKMGNLICNTYEDILNGDEYLNIRKSVRDDGKDCLCRHCTSARKCR